MENIKSVIETGKETETSLVSQVETMGEQESSVMEVEPKEQESSIIETEGGNEMESSAMEVEPKEQESVLSETGDDDNEGKSRETTWIEDLQVENDATVAGTLRAHKLVTDMADAPEKDGHGFYSSGAAYDYTPTHIDIDDSKQAEDGIVGLSLRNAANKVLGVVSKLYTGISEKDRKEIEEGSSTGVNQLRAWMENALAKLQWQYLSKEHDDTTDHNIGMGGLAVNGNASVSGDASINHDLAVSGNAMLNAVRSTDYDNSAEQGFSIEKDGNGKYQAFLTNLTIWGKAVFHELEVRKLSYAGGNINLSRAGSKIVKALPVKKVTATSGTSSTVTWEPCEVTDADCAGWKCYLLADNGTTATMNDWQEGDQARCETMGEITSSGSYENTANRSYWRTIPDGGVSTANEKIYGTKVEVYTDADGKEQKRETQVELYDGQMFAWVILGKHSTAFDGVTEGDASTSELQDVPQAGDTIVQDGNRHRGSDGSYDKTDRQNVIALETSGDYAPRIACYANITEYKHTVTKDGKEISLSVFETSPRGGTKINSSRFVWTSDDGSTINIINYRGDWSSSSTYHKNDQVNHNNAVWVCVANSGVDVKEEPSDSSSHWKKVLSGGKGEKGDPGKDAVTYGVQVTPTYEVWSDAKKHAGIVLTFTKTTGSTMLKYLIVKTLGTVKVCADGTEIEGASKCINDGNNKIIFDRFTFDGTNNTPTIGTASVISIELIVDDKIVATANYANGKQGDGVVMAYKRADTQPDAPTGTDPKSPGDGWSLSPDAATAGEKVTDVRYGGYESGTYDGNNKGTDATAKEWAEAEDDGRTWMKSPTIGNSCYALMQVAFVTQYDNATVDVVLKAYSEANYDFVEVWPLDSAVATGASFRGQGLAHTSGNGVEKTYQYTVEKAGRHTVCVTYTKDSSNSSNGDYGLFRLDLSDNETAVSATVWMSQATVRNGVCVLPWSTPVRVNGADGKGALEIIAAPETIVIDTDDSGLATWSNNNNPHASLMCLRDGKEVSGVTYKMDSCVNCKATVSNAGVVEITSVNTQSVTVDGQTVTVSCTSGSVTVYVTDPTTNMTYTKTIPFTVNVARYTGGLKADNKSLKSSYEELTNGGNIKSLKNYKSEILQSARGISLKVMEKSVGRRNLLVGSAFRKQGEGIYLSNDSGRYPQIGIMVNGGYDGTNAVRLVVDKTESFPGLFWNGSGGKNIKVEKGKKYTLSFMAKRLSSSKSGYEISAQFFLQDGENGYNRPYGALKYFSHVTESQDEWELMQDTVTIPSDAQSDYVEVVICVAAVESGGNVEMLICRPMLEEGEEYNGWTLSEQDYDYIGGNLLDGTGKLVKTGNVETINGTVTQGGMGESASIRSVVSRTEHYNDFLQYSTANMGLKANEDYVLSFYARTSDGGSAGLLQCYLYPSNGNIYTEDSDGKYDNQWNSTDGDLKYGIVVGTQWKRYWVHWRPTKNDPQHVLFRLLRQGNDRGNYSSSTSYAVGDIVLYDGTYYKCKTAGSGNTPSSSSSYWEAREYDIYISQPKLEVGATMTEWTEKRSDMVDKQALYATGIDIDLKKITLTADNTTFRGNDGKELAKIDRDGLRVPKMVTTDTGSGHTEISGNTTIWYNKDGVTPGIKVFYDAAGVPHFQFCNSNGKVMYDFGPSGLQSFISSTQNAYSDVCYLRDANSHVKTNTSGVLQGFSWCYVARNQSGDLRYIYRKQIPTTPESSKSEIYDGCVFTSAHKYEGTDWPAANTTLANGRLLADGWYVEPNDGNLPMKLRPADEEGVLDPTQTLYYQTFYYYSSGKVTRTVRAYMKKVSDTQVSKFEANGDWDEI